LTYNCLIILFLHLKKTFTQASQMKVIYEDVLIPFRFTYFPEAYNAVGIGICYHTAKVFTGSSRAVKFKPSVLRKIFLFPFGRAYLFAKNLTALNPTP